MKPRLFWTIWTDFPALCMAIVIPLVWIACLVGPKVDPDARFDSAHLIIAMAVPITLVSAFLLVWRILRIRRLFAKGLLVPGCVTFVRLVKDRGRVEFAYSLDGRDFRSWTPIHKNRRTKALSSGQMVEVLMDPSRPDTAIIQHLYL